MSGFTRFDKEWVAFPSTTSTENPSESQAANDVRGRGHGLGTAIAASDKWGVDSIIIREDNNNYQTTGWMSAQLVN